MPRRCYRAPVALAVLHRRGAWPLMAVVVAATSVPLAARQAPGPASAIAPVASDDAVIRVDGTAWLRRWWTSLNDPLLTRLVDAGLAADAAAAKADDGHGPDKGGRKVFSRKREGLALAAERKADIYVQAQHQAKKADQIARAYFTVLADQHRIAALEECSTSQKANIQIASSRFRAGQVPAYDANLARSQNASTAALIGDAESGLARNLTALAEMTGVDARSLRVDLSKASGFPVDVYVPTAGQAGDIFARRADLLALKQQTEAALLREGALQPEIDAVLADSATHDVPNGTAAHALAAYRRALQGAQAEVTAARETVVAAQLRVKTLESAVLSAQTALGDTRLAYNSGLDRFVSVYVAESALLDVRQGLVLAQRTWIDAVIGYYSALGGGWTLDYPQSGPAQPVVGSDE